MGWFLPGASFTKAVADTLYCSIASANCSSLYCTFAGGGGSGSNCTASINEACKDAVRASKTSAQSITATTFTTYTSASNWFSWPQAGTCIGPQGGAMGFAFCTASFYFTTNTTSVIASFQLNDLTGGGAGASATFQAQPAAANQAVMGSIAWQPNFQDGSLPNIALQAKVSAANMLVSVKTGVFWCLSEGASDIQSVGGSVG